MASRGFLKIQIPIFIWKIVVTIFYVVAVDTNSSLFNALWIISALSGIYIYVTLSIVIFYFVHIQYDLQSPLRFNSAYEDAELTMLVLIVDQPTKSISRNYVKIKFIALILFYIGITLIFTNIIISIYTESIPYLYTIGCIPVFIAIIMFQLIHYVRALSRSLKSLAFSIPVTLLAIWTCICLILLADFNVISNSLFISIPLILLAFIIELIYSIIQMFHFGEGAEYAICFIAVLCCVLCGFLTFFILFCIKYAGDNNLLLGFVFIPIWIIWLIQGCFLCCSIMISESSSDREPPKNIILSSLDSDQVDNINKALQYKHNIDVGHKYRRRCDDFIAEIISPNHVALDKNGYEIYSDHDEYLENNKYQWIPTQFKMQFKNDTECESYLDMKEEYIEAKLNSLYIPDINQFKHKELNQLILNILQSKIIPGFAQSIAHGLNNEDLSTCYKKTLFEWCLNRKVLNIIVKSQQYEFGSHTFKSPREMSRSFHVEGTQHEAISHVAICYTNISNNICGGELVLSFDDRMYDSWIYKPMTSSIIIFPNTTHKIQKMRRFGIKNNTVNCNRRILAFFLCDRDYYEQTAAFQAFTDKIEFHSQLLTATDLFPLDKVHCNDLFQDYLKRQLKQFNVPDIIILIIQQFVLDAELLRDETAMQENAIDLRRYRRDIEEDNLQQPHKPMVCD